jgi:hypothetical protein
VDVDRSSWDAVNHGYLSRWFSCLGCGCEQWMRCGTGCNGHDGIDKGSNAQVKTSS